MVYEVEWLVEVEAELRRFFSKRFQGSIVRKVEHIAANLPASLSLRGVQPVKGQSELEISGQLYELDIGSGARAAFVLHNDSNRLIVYLVGHHDYARENYLRAALERLTE